MAWDNVTSDRPRFTVDAALAAAERSALSLSAHGGALGAQSDVRMERLRASECMGPARAE